MADTRVILKQQSLRNLLMAENGPVGRTLDQRAARVIELARQYAPRSPGEPSQEKHFADTLTITKLQVRGMPAIRIRSNSEHARYVTKGTPGGYSGVPPTGAGSRLGDWMDRRGIRDTGHRRAIALHIAAFGTRPAEPADFLARALRDGLR